MFLGQRRDRVDLVEGIDGAEIARLGQRHRRRLAAMGLPCTGGRQYGGERIDCDLAVRPGDRASAWRRRRRSRWR